MKHTDTTKQKLSEMRKGERNPFFGRKHTPETKAKLAANLAQFNGIGHAMRQQAIRIPKEPTAFGYLAGILDGEGSIRFAGGRPFVAIYNTDARLMVWLVANVGGSYRPADMRGRTVCYCWRVSAAADVRVLCASLLPRLLIKHRDAERVLVHLEKRYG